MSQPKLLGSLEDILKMGPDTLLQGLAGLIDGVGTGTEWTGEQVDQLGELEQKLADAIRGLRERQPESMRGQARGQAQSHAQGRPHTGATARKH
jgi:hypothetical protein